MTNRPLEETDPTPRDAMPFNRLSLVALVLALVIMAVELVLTAAEAGWLGGAQGIGWRMRGVQDYAFWSVIWEQVAYRGNTSLEMTRRFVTYAFLHANFTHAIFGAAMVLALGKFVGDVAGELAVALTFLIGTIAGAVVYGLSVAGGTALVGAYPGVYALIGGFTWLLWVRLGERGQNQMATFRTIFMLLLIRLIFVALAPLFGASRYDPSFLAEVAGFAAGFVAMTVLAPGGFAALKARLRAR